MKSKRGREEADKKKGEERKKKRDRNKEEEVKHVERSKNGTIRWMDKPIE